MSIVCDRGVIKNILSGLENLPPELSLFEVIDNKEHSNSNAFFIDMDFHRKQIVIGFSESAIKEQIENMVKWCNVSDEHNNGHRIATRGVGLRLFEFTATGKYTHTTKVDDRYFTSYINTSKINDAKDDVRLSNIEFEQILNTETTLFREEDELIPRINRVFENTGNYFPFLPKTVFYATHIDNDAKMDYFSNKENQENIKKNLQIKYYREIYRNNFELYIKFPNDNNFTKITTDDCVDVIGYTNNFVEDTIHTTNIYISPENHFGHVIEVDNTFFKFEKNGNSILRNEIKNTSEYNLKTPDYTYTQYNVDFSKEEPSLCSKSIVGKSFELYAGLYIFIGDKTIGGDKVKWNLTDRNLEGHRNYRGVLNINTDKGKSEIALSGLKGQFDLTKKINLHSVIKQLTEIYKKYMKALRDSGSMTIQKPDAYIMTKSISKKSETDDKLTGYYYIFRIGENFWKCGSFFNLNFGRILDYNKKSNIEKIKKSFPNEKIYDNPNLVFLSAQKMKNILTIEHDMKNMIYELKPCVTYDSNGGSSGIREYFHCDSFYEDVLPEIYKKMEEYYN